jgi:hypothetical protein
MTLVSLGCIIERRKTMKGIHTTRKRWLLWSALSLLLVLGLALSTAVAEKPTLEQYVPAAPAAPAAPQGPEDGYLEVGVEWVEDYSTLGWSNLPATEPDALGLRNRLRNCGWISRFAYGNNSAWEQDWKGYNKPGGGKEYAYIDNVDLAYFAGHGGSSGFYFNSTVDDHKLDYDDCYMNWGDGDAEWIGIAACNVLADSHRLDWVWCMDGLHLLMGFTTTMADVPHGDWFGWYICHNYNMTQAWFRAADGLQPSGKVARVIAEQSYQFYDKWYNHTSADPWDYYYHWWDHTVGSEPARQVDISQLAGEMPVFETPALSLGEANAEWTQLGSAFGVSTTPRSQLFNLTQPDPMFMSDDNQLEMDPSSGLYAYTELDSLWAEPISTTKRTRQVSQEDAQDIADQFLNDNGLMPADAQFYEVTADTMSMAQTSGSAIIGKASENVLQTETTAWQVIYSRILTYTTPATLTHGVAQEIDFSVMGPGAKLKVYVAPEVTAGLSTRAMAQEAVIGGVGGWRSADSGRAVQETVPILDYNQIEALFNELEPTVALSYIPLDSTSRQVLSHTVAYYEQPIGTGQFQLIPVYVLDVEYTLEGSEVISTPAYIPANPQYMAPLAEIEADIPSIVSVGDQLVFEAVDASSNLADVGYDASLTFPLGSGDSENYLYNWYRDSVASENKLGSGPVLTYTVDLGAGFHPGSGTVAQTIILEVIDGGGDLQQEPDTSYATTQVDVYSYIFLPLNMRQ